MGYFFSTQVIQGNFIIIIWVYECNIFTMHVKVYNIVDLMGVSNSINNMIVG